MWEVVCEPRIPGKPKLAAPPGLGLETLSKPFTLGAPPTTTTTWDRELRLFSRLLGRLLFKRKKLLALLWGAHDCMDLVRVLWLVRERHTGEMAEVCPGREHSRPLVSKALLQWRALTD